MFDEDEDWKSDPDRQPPFRDGRVHVQAEMCSTCVFRPGDLMHLGQGRLNAIVRGNQEDRSALTCHQTLPYGTHPDEGEAICRGYWDGPGARSEIRELAEAMRVVREVP